MSMDPPLHLEPLPALSDNYIWLLADARGQAVVVDPGEDAPVEAALARKNLRLRAILLTHHHPDHTAGAAALRERHGATVFAPEDERITDVDRRVHEGDTVALEAPAVHFEVWVVPGHTRSHVAFVGEGLLFCGDTLFSLGCGRLFEGSPRQMLASLDRLATLPDDTRVCCGHEYTLSNAAFASQVEPDNPILSDRIQSARQALRHGHASVPSRMAEERAANPFLRVDSEAVVRWVNEHEGAGHDRTSRFAALRAAKDRFRA